MKLDLLDFSTPNVGYEDMEGKDVCGCCGTYYVVSPEELAEAKEAVFDLCDAIKSTLESFENMSLDCTLEGCQMVLQQALAKAGKEELSCREHWVKTVLGEEV